jgi:hypothetical protein
VETFPAIRPSIPLSWASTRQGSDLCGAGEGRSGAGDQARVFEKIKHLETLKCPFVNLPEEEAGRWGQGLTAEKMKECVWVDHDLRRLGV